MPGGGMPRHPCVCAGSDIACRAVYGAPKFKPGAALSQGSREDRGKQFARRQGRTDNAGTSSPPGTGSCTESRCRMGAGTGMQGKGAVAPFKR